MSIFHHLAERVFDGYLTLKSHIEKYPDINSKASTTYSSDFKSARKKFNDLGKEFEKKKKLIDEEVETIETNAKRLAVLKETMRELSKMMGQFRAIFDRLGNGDYLEAYGTRTFESLTTTIHIFNELLTTCHNQLEIINKGHRLLQKEERKVEK